MKKNQGISTMTIILIIIGTLLVAFTAVMVWVYKDTGGIPDTLCTCVFAALGGECGVMGWIRTTKDKNKEREWQLEDRTQVAETETEEKDVKG